MSKRHIPAIVFVGVVLLAAPVFAQDTTMTPTAEPTTTETTTITPNAPTTKKQIRADEQLLRDKLKEEKTTARDAMKERIEAAKIKYQTQKETLKKRLEAFKDEKKKEIVEKISDKIVAVNERRTTRMAEALKLLTTHLEKVEAKIAEAKAQGITTTSAETAVTSAKQAVTSAETAVTTQAGKTYTIAVTTDERAGTAVGATLKTLQTDLLAVHQKVINARLAVMNAVRALALLKPGVDTPAASGSAN